MWLFGFFSRIRRSHTPAIAPTAAPAAPLATAAASSGGDSAEPDPRAGTRPQDVVGLLSDTVRDTGQTVRLIMIVLAVAVAVTVLLGAAFLVLHEVVQKVHLSGTGLATTIGTASALVTGLTALVAGRARSKGASATTPPDDGPADRDDRPGG